MRDKDGTVITLGSSIFSKADIETASYKGPLGELHYSSTKKDETVVASKALNAYTYSNLARQANSAYQTSHSTKRILAGEETQRSAAKSAASLEGLRINAAPPQAAVP